ncbi:MAG: hypothetical protein RL456_3109 [Pseudomonadota bacterium]|jgi:CRISPR-associated protein Csd1
MILQSLHGYYERRMRDPDPLRRLPAPGLEDKEIPFILEITRDGSLVGITDTRRTDGRKRTGTRFLVPQGLKKASGIAANLLWDNPEYVLGFDARGKPHRVAGQFAAFRERVDQLALQVPDDEGLLAVRRFLAGCPLADVRRFAAWAEIAELRPLPLLTFRLHDDEVLVSQRAAVLAAVQMAGLAADDLETPAHRARCLVTGEAAAIQRLHPAIKGVWGAQSVGANIVAVNNQNLSGNNGGSTPAFASFGKQQGYNAPVGLHASFTYTTALNHLLARGSRQRMQVGDASTVFWAESDADADFEDAFASLLDTDPENPAAHPEQVRALLDALQAGRFDGPAGRRRFHVLGLSPNAARIAVRFWHVAALGEVAQRLRQWFEDLALAGGPSDPEFPPLFRLLTSVSLQNKADNVPPSMGGDLMRAILGGGPFPAAWFAAAVQRSRAERHVTYLRAAVIKAWLCRTARLRGGAPVRASLDAADAQVAYRLGRLFAIHERIQEEASPGQGGSLRERHLGLAACTPAPVFESLARQKDLHLGRLAHRGRAAMLGRLLAEAMPAVPAWPRRMALPDQGRFILGYYQQRQAFFARPDDAVADPR